MSRKLVSVDGETYEFPEPVKDQLLGDVEELLVENMEDPDSDFSTGLNAHSDVRFGEDTRAPEDFPTAFIANGNACIVEEIVATGATPLAAHVEGNRARAVGWNGHAEGESSLADGKISHAEGNTSICSSNDAHAEGNRTVAGRRYYRNPAGGFLTSGVEDAGSGLGALRYAIIPDDYGDVSSYFPNKLTNNVTTRYGAGASMDTQGNIYGSTTDASGVNTPAVWDGVSTDPAVWDGIDTSVLLDQNQTSEALVEAVGSHLVTPNNLQWSLAAVCIIRGSPSETAIGYARIAKVVYTGGVGTKVYWHGKPPGSSGSIIGLYSSYSPVVLQGGNGAHSEGFITSAYGYGAHAEGRFTRAWADSTHAEGRETAATAVYSHSEGYQTTASGIASRTTGQQSVASRDYQHAHSAGKRVNNGDSQWTVNTYSKSVVDAGWHEISVLSKSGETFIPGGSYHFDAMVMGRQTAGSAGVVGDVFAYKFNGLVSIDADGSVTTHGSVTRTLVARSNGMTGDGLTTGVRMSWYTPTYVDDSIKGRLILRLDGLLNTTFWVQTRAVIQEFVA